MSILFPSPQHERAAGEAVDCLSVVSGVHAVLLVGSCARGKGIDDMDLEVMAEASAHNEIWHVIEEFETRVHASLQQLGPRHHVDLGVSDGHFAPVPRGWTSGPDDFELRIGNHVRYAVALWQTNRFHDRLRRIWLPSYDEDFRSRRLAEVIRLCTNNIDHIDDAAERGQYFQAFNRLYDAFREFLQALHISHRVYPIAYDKWINEQVVENLRLPDLYPALPGILSIRNLESNEIAKKGDQLRALLADYVELPNAP